MSASPVETSSCQRQQGDVAQSVHGNYKQNALRGTKSDGCGAHLFIVYIVVLPARAGREFFEGKGGFFQHV